MAAGGRTPRPVSSNVAGDFVPTENGPATVALDEGTRIKLPLRWIVSLSAALIVLGGVLSLLRFHAGDEVRHLDAKAVSTKGGPVYREDLRDVRDALDQRIRAEGEQTRAAVRAPPAPRPLRCRSVGRGELLCAFE